SRSPASSPREARLRPPVPRPATPAAARPDRRRDAALRAACRVRPPRGRVYAGSVKVLVLAAAFAAFTTAPAHATKPACGPAPAKGAVAVTNPRMKLLGDSQVRVAPSSADRVLCHDFPRDGRTDLAFTIASGGTAGDVGFAVLRATPTAGWRVALARSGY